MGWFNKNEDEKETARLPELPSLPKLPEMNFNKDKKNNEPIHQLPSFPSSSLGQKFSQNAIKEAVTGKKECEEDLDADEFDEDEENQMMQLPLRNPSTREISSRNQPRSREISEDFREASQLAKRNEPVFIRLDKFEEGLHIFEKAKREISDIERTLGETKKLKAEEESRLEEWENEIQAIKKQIEDIDKDIFSKVE